MCYKSLENQGQTDNVLDTFKLTFEVTTFVPVCTTEYCTRIVRTVTQMGHNPLQDIDS